MDFKKEFFKYFQYWPWFLLSLIICLGSAFFYIKSVSPTYETSAVVFLDKKKEEKTQIITISSDAKNKEDNLEDEIRLVTSNDFLLKVVRNLNYNITYFQKVYNIKSSFINAVPFIVTANVSNDSLPEIEYDIKLDAQGFTIVDPKTKQGFTSNGYEGKQSIAGLPFSIQLSAKAKQDPSSYFGNEYAVRLEPTGVLLNQLKESLSVFPDGESKGTLEFSHKGTNPIRSRQILTEIISLFDKYIVINKQKSFKNTVAYLNDRIKNFSKEKDSIESAKENFLKNNDILVMESYVVDKTKDKYDKNENSMLNERQIGLTINAINDIKSSGITSALGTDYNIESPSVNQMLLNYNSKLLESELILQRAQQNNPAYVSVVSQLKIQKQAILNSLAGYLSLLKQTNKVNRNEQSMANSAAKSIPTKDRILGNINSKLGMKEETYVMLLQKREEAVLNGAILESNLTTLNSPETNYSPVFPQPKPFMLGAFLMGILVPFGIVYVKLQLDSKIHNEEDILSKYPNIPFLGTIPTIGTKEILDNSASSRSVIAEATRTMFSNISYLLPVKQDNKGNVILFTSSIQGEGKSFCALHNAITISNMNKKVLLIGVDLRNPQLHEYFNTDKGILGLTNYLSNKSDDWKEFLIKNASFSENLDVLLSGEIPPNPTQLLTNTNFDALIEEAKGIYDFIILDTAPVQMVSDTFNFSQLADVTVFVTKYDFTDKNLLVQVNNFIKKEQLKNVGVIINGVSTKSSYGYNYGYNYNYGYGYEYKDSKKKRAWYKRMFS